MSTGDRTPDASTEDATVALAAAAHEIKNVLGPLGMTLQMAERQLLGGQPIAPADLAFARAQVRRLASLVDDLLDLTRADLGELPFRPRTVDLREVVTEAVETFKRGRSAAVTLELSDAPLAVSVDVGRMVQVLINLLENAVRYSPAGHPVVVATIRVGATTARIEVRDRGPGLGADEQQRIFGRFVRGAAAEGTSGLGIGLYLCRAIVERHGGTIGVDSVAGAGATFWIEIRLS
jgi:two-component system, sensor histidine kinase